MTTTGTVIVGPLETQEPEHALELFASASGKMGFPATTTTDHGAHFIRGVRIEPLFNGSCGELQHALAQGQFQSLEIQLGDGLPA
jgi:hypothetical protein